VPTPTPPVACTTPVALSSLAKGFGTWVVITTTSAGPVSAAWPLPRNASGRLAIYAGRPFAGRTNPVKLAPPGGALAAGSGTGTRVSAASGTVAAGQYTVYFYGSTAVAATLGSITGRTSTCPAMLTRSSLPVRVQPQPSMRLDGAALRDAAMLADRGR
jgi:hypothetical protein